MATAFNDIPPELKPLTPFLQRAQELKVKDPTMSYWCSYYAVQQGVHLKPRDKASRNYLVKLMAPLEAVREDPQSNVLTNNEAACAYIEDFALRVFDAADNEDRRGMATRGTAKKFLAAANFLELLKVFEENNSTQGTGSSSTAPASQVFSQHKEKLRYAKWKAADIAKAFREGRRPSPGPAHGQGDIPTGYSSPSLDPVVGKDVETSLNLAPNSNSSSVILPPNTASSSKALSNPPSNTNSRIVSPNPGASRDASVSPRGGHTKLGSGDTTGKGKGVSPNPSGFINPMASGAAGRPMSALPTPPSFQHTLPVPPSLPSFDTQTPPSDTPSSGQTPVTPNGKASSTNQGNWSTQATPGPLDDLMKRNSAQPPTPSPIPPFYPLEPSQKQEGVDAPYPPRPYPAPNFRPPVTPHIKPSALQPSEDGDDGTRTEGEDDKDGWSAGKQRAGMSRNASWATNAATVGGPSRQTSFYESNTPAEPYYGQNLPNRPGVATPENEWVGETEDKLGPLVDQGKPAAKRVRWTPSVTGGLSSVASTSPPGSPRSETTELAGGNAPSGSPPRSLEKPALGTNKTKAQPVQNGTTPTGAAPLTHQGDAANAPQSGRSSPPGPTSSAQNWGAPFPSTNSAVQPGNPSNTHTRHRASASFSGLTPSMASTIPPAVPPKPYPSPPSTATSSSTATTGVGRAPSPLQLQLHSHVISASHPHSANGTPTSASFRSNGSFPSSSSAPQRQLPTQLPFRLVAAAKKHSKFAASALEFDDLDTARLELTRALAILNGERTE